MFVCELWADAAAKCSGDEVKARLDEITVSRFRNVNWNFMTVLQIVPPFFIRPGYSTNGKLATVSLSTKALGQEPFAFQISIGRIIKGLEEGVLRMATGEMAKIHCCMLYGNRWSPHAQKRHGFSATRKFEIEILSII
eukprot:scaffold1046_cov230-Chaetoceros_neogracile.AAC.2